MKARQSSQELIFSMMFSTETRGRANTRDSEPSTFRFARSKPWSLNSLTCACNEASLVTRNFNRHCR